MLIRMKKTDIISKKASELLRNPTVRQAYIKQMDISNSNSNLYLSFFQKTKTKNKTRMTTIILYISISIGYAQRVVHNKTFHNILHNVQFQCFIILFFFFYLEKKRRNKKLNLAC